ncbi:MAG TPA: nuclear transport factor 2 family protein [Acetobacteraceae bacterium]|nr:nuclear transport factor 2 family protein [Acetobacteraceae bacterium]
MPEHWRWLICILAVSLAAGATPPPAHAAAAGDRAAIRSRLAHWTQAFNARASADVCDLFAPDLVYAVPDKLHGTRASLCGNLARLFARPGLQLHYDEPDIHEIILAGDLAVVRLTWTLTVQTATDADTSTEEGIDIFRRQPGGRWSIARFLSFTTRPNRLLQ